MARRGAALRKGAMHLGSSPELAEQNVARGKTGASIVTGSERGVRVTAASG